jgi:hypothetical protein
MDHGRRRFYAVWRCEGQLKRRASFCAGQPGRDQANSAAQGRYMALRSATVDADNAATGASEARRGSRERSLVRFRGGRSARCRC